MIVIRNLIYISTAVCFLMMPPRFGAGAFLYKNYVIRQYQGRDILCDPYVVEKNDSVIRLFQQRGQIAGQDFPEFLRIFQQFNPHIPDVDAIQPGQDILIPLKKLGEDALPGQSEGVVAIPFMAITQLSDLIHQNAEKYEVKTGDSLSVIISNSFGKFGTRSYNEGVALFKLINPEIDDLNHIRTGQILNIPDKSVRNRKWYASIFDDRGNLNRNIDLNEILNPSDKLKNRTFPKSSAESEKSGHDSPLSIAAEVLNSRLIDRGTYYFPRSGNPDLALDLSRHPVMELESGRRLLFWEKDYPVPLDLQALTAHWKELKIVPLPVNAGSEEILQAIFTADKNFDVKNQLHLQHDGVDITIRADWIIASGFYDEIGRLAIHQTCLFLIENEARRIPASLKRYLLELNIRIREIRKKDFTPLAEAPDPSAPNLITPLAVVVYTDDLRKFVPDWVKAMGFLYSGNINISFPYAGLQIEAISNLIATKDGNRQMLVDFGDLYGDAVSAIRNTGLEMIQLTGAPGWEMAVKQILDAMNLPYSAPLNFTAIKDSRDANIFLNFPGLRLEIRESEKAVVTSALLHPELIGFLNQSGHQTILIEDLSRLGEKGKTGPDSPDSRK